MQIQHAQDYQLLVYSVSLSKEQIKNAKNENHSQSQLNFF